MRSCDGGLTRSYLGVPMYGTFIAFHRLGEPPHRAELRICRQPSPQDKTSRAQPTNILRSQANQPDSASLGSCLRHHVTQPHPPNDRVWRGVANHAEILPDGLLIFTSAIGRLPPKYRRLYRPSTVRQSHSSWWIRLARVRVADD